MTLRLRLSLIFSLVVALAIAVPGATLYVTSEKSLRSEMDRRLLIRADEVQYALWPGADHPNSTDLQPANIDLSPLADLDAPGLQVQILDTSGHLLKASDSLQGELFPVATAQIQSALGRRPGFADAVIGHDRPVRLVIVPVLMQNHVAALLQVSQSRALLQDAMDGLRRLLIVIGSAAVLLAGVIGWLISYLGLRPLSAISQQASEIAVNNDFRQRLKLVKRRGEIGELADTIDGLLAKVYGTLQAHRDFMADTSHELRNPLLSITTNAGLLNRLDDPTERAECIRDIQQQGQRMTRLISDLLILAQVERGLVLQVQPIDLLDIVERTVREARSLARGQTIRVQHEGGLQIVGDADRLRQILINLLENAIRHTPPKGIITVRTRSSAGGAELEIEDTGKGISREHLPHIFERGFMHDSGADERYSGHGLGLAIVKYLAEAHGGRVAVQSGLGLGTSFTIWLPVGTHVVGSAPLTDSPAGAIPGDKVRPPRAQRASRKHPKLALPPVS